MVITLPLPGLLSHPDCDCCVGHLIDALAARAGVGAARRQDMSLAIEVDPRLVAAAEVSQIARDAGALVGERYDHPQLAVEGMDCAECATTIERALGRLPGVHYATVNLATATLRLEYDRQQTSLDAITALLGRLGYRASAPEVGASFVGQVEGLCCAAEAGPIERAVGQLPGVSRVVADPALARLSVTYDPQLLDQRQIVAQVERLGFRMAASPGALAAAPAQPVGRRWPALSQAGPRDLATLACGLLIAAAWVAGLAGASALSAAFYVLATLTGGMFVARSGWASLTASRTLDINALMTIAAVGALLIGEYAEGAVVVFLFALGNALEGYTMDRARRSIRALMQLAPETALVVRANGERRVPVGEVAPGETIVVRPGDRVAMDGVVVRGSSAVDQAPITGESVPVDKDAGSEVFAGSINGEGALEVQVTRPADGSTLARIIHLVGEAQANKAPSQRFIDVFARYYTPAVLVLAALVALVPPLALGGGWGEWIYRALVLLVVACPCALVISTPVSIVSAISAAARAGVLFKGGAALEASGSLRALAFDKTGTLTIGKPVVADFVAFEEDHDAGIQGDKETRRQGDKETTGLPAARVSPSSPLPLSPSSPLSPAQRSLLTRAAAVERRSAHPLARAIVERAEALGLRVPAATEFWSAGGRGASGLVDGRRVTVGNRAMFDAAAVSPVVEGALEQVERRGMTGVLVGWDGAIHGVIALADAERPESRAAVAELGALGLAPITMLTGDTARAAERIASTVGVGEVRAGLMPEQKLQAVDALLAAHGRVGMVGDGVNDAPALARATVGIAMGAAGSDVALETADVALMSDDLSRLPFAIRLSRQARQIIIQNIAFALLVKAAFLVASLLGVATLWMAVFADTGAALIVVANGMRLLRRRP